MRQYVVEKYGDDVIKHGKVVKVYRNESRAPQSLQVHLFKEHGMETVVYADLVIGADGVKSLVRRDLFGDDESYRPTYSGQSGVGGFYNYNTTIAAVIAENKAMVFEFGIVLIGDEAHALDPTTGQGAIQALEDSQTFALLLAEVFDVERYDCSQTKWATNQVIEMYFEIRSPRVQKIIERGKKLAGSKASVGIVKEYIMYLFLWLLIKFPSLGESRSFVTFLVRADRG
ncbi:hypothetical protein E8E11_010417 [Didymella keratinophila]|nr:hypothetical protein E8E11_010417 [Didymella keratinophila]